MKLRRSSNDQQDAAPVAAEPIAPASQANDATAALGMQASDVQSARFHTARKGYHKGEVDDFLDRVEAAIEAKNARIAELEAQTGASPAPAAAPVAAAPVAAAPVAAAPVTAPATPDTAFPTQQSTPIPAPQVTPAYGAADVLSAAVPDQAPAVAPATAAPSGATGGDGSFAAGWYADPWSQATYRYYDGNDWTAQTR